MALSTRACLTIKTAIVAIPLIAMGALYSIRDYREAIESERGVLSRVTNAVSVANISVIAGAQAVLTSLLVRQTVADRDWRACSDNFGRFLARSPGYLGIAIAEQDGTLACSGTPQTGNARINISDRDWFRRALTTNEVVLSNFLTGRVSGRPTITMAMRGNLPDGTTVVAVLSIDLDWLNEKILQQVLLPKHANVILLDPTGVAITALPDMLPWRGRSFAGSEFFTVAKAGHERVADVRFPNGEEMLMVSSPVMTGDAVGLFVVSALPKRIVETGALSDAGLYMGGIFIAALLLLTLAWLFAERMVRRPLALVARAAERFSTGDRNARVGAIMATSEIASVAGSFDRMADTLSARDALLVQANTDLRNARDTLSATLGTSPAVIIFLGNDRKVTLWNAAAERIFGWKEDEVMERPCPVVRQDRQPAFDEFFDRAMRDETVMNMQTTLASKDGKDIRVSINAEAVHAADGSHSGVVFVVNDITAILQTERALMQSQKMETVGQLTGGIAHDFNNLLAVIIGNLDLLTENPDQDAESRETLEQALDAALRGAELTRQLLAFSRLQPLRPSRTNLNDIVRNTTRLLNKVLGENITIATHLTGEPWEIVADTAQIEAALMNLAVNARDAMANGGRLIIETANAVLDEDYVQTSPDAVPGSYAMLAVSDTGCGMPPEVLAKVFDPFFTTKPAGEGTGLGLSMVYGFVKQSGGHAKIYSEPGIGTTVRLYFPKADGSSPDTVTAGADEPAGSIGGNGEVILVVEDKADVRRIACRQLKNYGYAVIEAENGSAALVQLREARTIDLLFTDMIMPGDLSGLELAAEARKLRPELKVLFTSGFPGMVLPPEILTAGALLLSKPYRHQELARLVHRILGRGDV